MIRNEGSGSCDNKQAWSEIKDSSLRLQGLIAGRAEFDADGTLFDGTRVNTEANAQERCLHWGRTTTWWLEQGNSWGDRCRVISCDRISKASKLESKASFWQAGRPSTIWPPRQDSEQACDSRRISQEKKKSQAQKQRLKQLLCSLSHAIDKTTKHPVSGRGRRRGGKARPLFQSSPMLGRSGRRPPSSVAVFQPRCSGVKRESLCGAVALGVSHTEAASI